MGFVQQMLLLPRQVRDATSSCSFFQGARAGLVPLGRVKYPAPAPSRSQSHAGNIGVSVLTRHAALSYKNLVECRTVLPFLSSEELPITNESRLVKSGARYFPGWIWLSALLLTDLAVNSRVCGQPLVVNINSVLNFVFHLLFKSNKKNPTSLPYIYGSLNRILFCFTFFELF